MNPKFVHSSQKRKNQGVTKHGDVFVQDDFGYTETYKRKIPTFDDVTVSQ